MSEPYDHSRPPDVPSFTAADPDGEIEEARENVFDGWPSSEDVRAYAGSSRDDAPAPAVAEPEPAPDASAHADAERTSVFRFDDDAVADEPGEASPEAQPELPELPGLPSEPVEAPAATLEEGEDAAQDAQDEEPLPVALVDPAPVVHAPHEHAPGELEVPPGYGVLEGVPDGSRRAVGVVVSRFNGEITTRLLASALGELERAGVPQEAVTVMPVPGAFELPIGAMALARTRRFACIVALGCVIRGDTPHFDYVASEAASGLQLAALETGVPVAFGVLTLERADQAEPRIEKGAESVRTALEMADLFSHLRAAAAR